MRGTLVIDVHVECMMSYMDTVQYRVQFRFWQGGALSDDSPLTQTFSAVLSLCK